MTSRHGLANIGNTCYLNSALQCLSKTGPFKSYFGEGGWKIHEHEDRAGHALAVHTADIVKILHEPGDNTVIPSKFVRAFIEFARKINGDIRHGAQADAAEAIQILLDGLHMQVARDVRMNIKGAPTSADAAEVVKSYESWSSFYSKEYSSIVENFYGQTQIKVICDTCKNCSTRYEPWSVMKSPIPGADKVGSPAPSLAECIASTFDTSTIEGYDCDTCKKKCAARMERSVSRFPKNLIVALNRFTNEGFKVRARISYSADLVDMSQWRSWPSIQPAATYRIMSTVEHLGMSRGGHYVMRARDEQNDWYVYDDGRVAVSGSGGEAGPDTYILFLEQI